MRRGFLRTAQNPPNEGVSTKAGSLILGRRSPSRFGSVAVCAEQVQGDIGLRLDRWLTKGTPKSGFGATRSSFWRPLLGSAAWLLLASCGGGSSDQAGVPETKTLSHPLAVALPSLSRWSAPIPLSLAPSSAAHLPNGNLLLWASSSPMDNPGVGGQTFTSTFDSSALTATSLLVSQTGHNMFCTGTSNLPDGTLLINGGTDSAKTSLYNPTANSWTTGATMNTPRGYGANTVLQDGSVFTLGGSWSGGVGGKNGEVWTAAGGWRSLSGVPVGPALGSDPGGVYRSDNHMWLFSAPNGQVLHAGPSANMNWISTAGNGSISSAGTRSDDAYSMAGNAVMYDIGKILKVGGAAAYEGVLATTASYVIDINSGVSVRKVGSMTYPRIFSNGVVLPNGQVIIIGGQTIGKPFFDDNSILVPELWDPATETFTQLPPIAAGRNYHSVALLMPDGRVISAGGGLCGTGCAGNHPDAQILTPHYLLNPDGTPATRPQLTSAPSVVALGTSFSAVADSTVASFALVRMSSTTHTVNNDQRRIPLQFTAAGGGGFNLQLPSNPGILLPGYYMLFAMNADGTPSIAKILRVDTSGAPTLTNPGKQTALEGSPVQLTVTATTTTGVLTYAAQGLPTGLSIDAASGVISGVATTPGAYSVVLSASNATATASTNLQWSVSALGTGTSASARYAKLDISSEVTGGPRSSMAEFNLLDATGAVISRSGWVVKADSQELVGENGAATNAIDGKASTFWHTQWTPTYAPLPHSFVVDTGVFQPIGGFKYLPRTDGNSNGTIGQWQFSVSSDGLNWVLIGQGNFGASGAYTAEQKAFFPPSTANIPPTLGALTNQSSVTGNPATLGLIGSDVNGDVLTYSATGLPPGLTVNTANGIISGTPTTAGSFSVAAQVSDGRGGTASVSFTWTIASANWSVNAVNAPPSATGSAVNYSVGSGGGAGTVYRWNFGDGTATTTDSTSTSISHGFAGPGLYTVTVTATDTAGTVKTLTFTQAIYGALGATRPTGSSTMALEPRSAASTRLWVVNQDNDSVSVFDTATNLRLAEVAVGSMPRSVAVAPDGRIWVVNKGASSISVISPSSLAVVQTIATPRASLPFGVAFSPDASAAYVTMEALGQLYKYSPTSGALLGTVAVGATPRHLSVAAASDRILVSLFITPPLPGEGTAVVQTASGSTQLGGQVVVVNAPSFGVERTVALRHSDKVDNALQGRGVPNYLGAPVIAPDGTSAWVPSKQDNIKRGTLRDGQNLDFQNSVRAISSRIDLSTFSEDYAARVDHDNSSLGSAAAFHPTGAYLFVALQTSRQIAVIDPIGKAEIFRFDAGRAPDGLAVSSDGLRLYVNNFMDRTVGVYDLTPLVTYGQRSVTPLVAVGAVTTEKLTSQVLNGKQLFYDARDPRLSRDAYMSCATCHSDGGHDGRVWDFTGLGEGLRNTIALRGRAGGHGFLHWSGNFDESHDFEGQIRTLNQGSGLMTAAQFATGTRSQALGDPKKGVSTDLDALAAYLASLTDFFPTPYRNSDGSLTAGATAGKAVFAANCVSCHSGTAFTDSGANTLKNIGTLKPSSGTRLGAPLTGIDTPTLRDVWLTAPYLHDGSATSVDSAISAHTSIVLSATDLANVAAYVQQIGREEPGTGVQYVKLEALSEVNGNPWTSMAEFNVLDGTGAIIARTGWIVAADSQETAGENGAAINAIDGSATTIWHTQWSTGNPAPPHTFTVNLGKPQTIGGFKYLPRQSGGVNGTISNWRFSTSVDGVNWVIAGTGTFANSAAEKIVTLSTLVAAITPSPPVATQPANQPPTLAVVANQTGIVGTTASLGLLGADPNNDPLTYAATGLPAGLILNATSGAITGTPTTAATYNVTATVSDGRGGSASRSFTWTIAAANQPPTLAVVANQTGTVGTTASLGLLGADPNNDPLTYAATGLPAGLILNATSGAITGTPTTAATYNVTATVSDGRGGSASRSFTWTIAAAASTSVRFVRLEALTEVSGKAWASMAEFNVLDANGATIPRTGWSVVADSQETVGENGAAVNALDGSAKTFWHTQWFASNPQPPHTFTVDMGQPQNVRGFKYLPRADGNTNGMIANWRFWTSTDGVTWSLVTQGTFVKSSAEKTVTLP